MSKRVLLALIFSARELTFTFAICYRACPFRGELGPSSPRKGHSSPPLFGACLLWPWTPISATAELLLFYLHTSVASVKFAVTGRIAHSAKRRYISYSKADFEVFRPVGATRCTDWVKLGTEESTKGPLLRAKFHRHRCIDKGIGPPKLNYFY